MKPHPYLRAYMAGITLPTLFLLVAMTVFTFSRFVYDIDVPVERLIVFPMAIIPNLWGLWNMLYVRLRPRRIPLGIYGALLPLVVAPLAVGITSWIHFTVPPFIVQVLPIALPVAMGLYYLLWKHAVGFFNETLGIA